MYTCMCLCSTQGSYYSHLSNICSPMLFLVFVTVKTECTPHGPVILYYAGFHTEFFSQGGRGGGRSLVSDLARIIMIYV